MCKVYGTHWQPLPYHSRSGHATYFSGRATRTPPCSEHLDYVADSAIPTLAITAAAAAATSNLSTARRLAARGHTAHHLAARRPTAHRPTEPWHEQRADRARRCVRDCASVSERERALSVRPPRVAHGRVRLVVCASRSMERGLEAGAPAYACAVRVARPEKYVA